MIQKIYTFDEGCLSLSDLIYDLEALLNLLTKQDQCWKNSFRGYWWDLEQVYAVALNDEKKELNCDEKQIINNAVDNLKQLIESKLYYCPIIRNNIKIGISGKIQEGRNQGWYIYVDNDPENASGYLILVFNDLNKPDDLKRYDYRAADINELTKIFKSAQWKIQ